MSSRLLVQSGLTFHFLFADPRGDVQWTPSLLTALRFGVIPDFEQAHQMVEDHCDRGAGLVIDLDHDYPE